MRNIFLVLLCACLRLQAQDLCSMLADLKATTYDFSPSSLTRLEKTAKVKGLDRFWELAKREPIRASSCLRPLLQKERKGSFFLFDGSQLLWGMDKSSESATVVADALAQVNLNDIRPYDYVALAIQVATAGADITGAAMNFARAGNASDYQAGAGPIMNREEGMVLLFAMLPEDVTVKKAISLHEAGEGEASACALLLLSVALTPEALAYLRKDGVALSAPATIQRQVSLLSNGILRRTKETGPMNRAQIQRMMQLAPSYPDGSSGPYGNDGFLSSAFAELLPEDSALIRSARRRSIVDPSPASLAQYYAYTQILQLVETKAGLYRSAGK